MLGATIILSILLTLMTSVVGFMAFERRRYITQRDALIDALNRSPSPPFLEKQGGGGGDTHTANEDGHVELTTPIATTQDIASLKIPDPPPVGASDDEWDAWQRERARVLQSANTSP